MTLTIRDRRAAASKIASPRPWFSRLLLQTLAVSVLGLVASGCATVDQAEVVDQPPPVPPTSEMPSTDSSMTDDSAAQAATVFDPSTASLDQPLPPDPTMRIGTLDNGLRYYLKANSKPEARAELRLAIDAGSLLEDEDQLGMAHFVEHMAFNGTEHFEKHELLHYLQSIGMRFGADINASTNFDQTIYNLTIPTDDPEVLDQAFLVLADWAGRVTLEDEEIDKERGVIVEEWRLSQGAGMRLTDRQLPVIFEGSRYADRLPIGTKESIETTPGDALRRFYKDWYRPDLQAVVAVGDFDVDAVEKLVEKHLGSLPAAPTDARERPVYEIPGHPEPKFSIETDPELTGTSVAVLFKHPRQDEGALGDYRSSLVEMLFGQMLNARFSEIAQSSEPPFVLASAGGGSWVREGYFYQLEARVKDGDVERGLQALLTEVARVEQHGFVAGELERAKTDVRRLYEQLDRERDQQPSGGFASEFVRSFLTGESTPGIAVEVALVERFVPEISLEEVNALARELIIDDNQVVMLTAPDASTSTASLPSEQALAQVFTTTEQLQVEPWVDRTLDQPLLAATPTPSRVVDTAEHEELGVTEWRLANGVRVILKPTDFKNDEIMFTAWSPGGTSLASDEDSTSASFATFLLGQSGLGDFDLVQLEKALAGEVASASPFVTELSEGFSGGGSPEDLETALQLVYLWFTQPRLDQQAVKNVIGRMSTMLLNRSKNPATVYQDKLNSVLSGDHYRRRPLTTEVLSEVDGTRALETYRDRFADASDFTFLFVGNIDLETFQPLAEIYLGGLPTTDRQETWRDVGVKSPEGVVRFEVEQGLEPKSTVNLIFHGSGEWTRDNRFQLMALARVVEMRLIELVREEMGAVYRIGASGAFERWPNEEYSLTINFSCDPDKVDSILEAIFATAEQMKTEGPAAGDVDNVRENLRRQRQVSLRENGFWMQVLRSYYENVLPLDDLMRYDELLQSLDVESMKDAATRYLDQEQYVVGVLDPAPEVLAASADG